MMHWLAVALVWLEISQQRSYRTAASQADGNGDMQLRMMVKERCLMMLAQVVSAALLPGVSQGQNHERVHPGARVRRLTRPVERPAAPREGIQPYGLDG
jgi:hypothetical protein